MAFQQKTLDLFGAVNGILSQYDGPLTLRQVYYRLVAAQIIQNTENEYKGLSKHLTNARLAGLVDDSRIIDRVRSTLRVQCWPDLSHFLQTVRRAYRREKWTSQDYNLELWCEKDAVAGVLEPIANEYEIILYPCRGYNSYSALKEAAERIGYIDRPTGSPRTSASSLTSTLSPSPGSRSRPTTCHQLQPSGQTRGRRHSWPSTETWPWSWTRYLPTSCRTWFGATWSSSSTSPLLSRKRRSSGKSGRHWRL